MLPHASSHTSGDGDHIPDAPGAAKADLRRRLLGARRTLDAEVLAHAEQEVLAHLVELPELRSAHTVAAYVSVGREPRTRALLNWLVGRKVRVLVPVLMDDNDLDWAEYRGPEDLAPAARGLQEPMGPRCGPQAITQADVVVLPGVAADDHGHRLGRGGGSYDRALARLHSDPTTPAVTVLLLHTGEFGHPVPVEAHDRAVDVVVTPTGGQRGFTVA